MAVRARIGAACVLAACALPSSGAWATERDTSGSAASAAAAITTSQAVAMAKAGILTKRDMPGFDVSRRASRPSDTTDERAVYRCLGARMPSFAARNGGRVFLSGALEVDSSANVTTTVAAARRDLKAFTSRRAPGCMKHELARVLQRLGGSVDSASVKPLSVDVPGSDGSFAFKYAATGTIHGHRFKLIAYDLDVLVGQTELKISPGAYNAPSPSLRQPLALAKILVERVRAA